MPSGFKTATTIDRATGRQIDQIVLSQFRQMMQSDPLTQKAVREALVADAKDGAAAPSPAYAARYAQAISDAVTSSLLTSTRDYRARFNAALTVAKVAAISRSPKLEQAVLTLLDEKRHDAVKLAGIKAAKAILPGLAKARVQQNVAERVLAVAKSCPTGAMTSEAYEALCEKPFTDGLLSLLTYRVSMYQNTLPEDPDADAMPFLFLQRIWNQGPDDSQKRTLLKEAHQLLVLAAQHADAQSAGTSQHQQLKYVIQKVSESLQIIAQKMPSSTLEAAAQRLSIQAGNSSAAFSQAIKPVCAEIRKLKGCEQIEALNLDTQLSVNPATGSVQ